MSNTLLLRSALLMGASAITLSIASPALAAAASASDNSGGGTTIGELVVTAEKREQNLQDVPVAISAFTSAKRDLIGVQTIQDMTNFTPGLQYSTSTDRISLRGVGRQTNVLSADAAVANYNDGVYETFAVAAGRSSLFLDRVEILRGPQGTLYGRNAIGGAINEISRRPSKQPYAEARISYENYKHINIQGAVSGPLSDNVGFRLSGQWEKQSDGWIKNTVPGRPSEGNVIDEWFLEGQIEVHFNDRLEMWTKVAGAQWHNGGGGPGAASGGWSPVGYSPYEYNASGVVLNPGYACSGVPTDVTSSLSISGPGGIGTSPACTNPELKSPWAKAQEVPYKVYLPAYIGVASHWTWHADDFDIKYVTGGVYYHYVLTGPTTPGIGTPVPPITSFTVPCDPNPVAGGLCQATGGLVIHPQASFNYQELNGFWSHEINILSTKDGPLQWLFGAYLFNQHYHQPVTASDHGQSELNGPFPFGVCETDCPNAIDERWFDNRPDVHARSAAAFGQISYQVTEQLKITGGLRYSWDRKWGTESVRLTCYAVAVCGLTPEQLGNFLPYAIDLTGVPSVVANDPTIPGVKGPDTYDPVSGLLSRQYDSKWSAITGSLDLEYKPNDDALGYFKYSRGYKSGGFNIGIFTVLSYFPKTDKELVDSFEIGWKQNIGHSIQINTALFYYAYKNLQIPITIPATGGGVSQSATAFYNVPKAVSQGIELETTWRPIDNLTLLFNYSYLDAHVKEGAVEDAADPAAIFPGARPLLTTAFCAAHAGDANPPCAPDAYTEGVPGGGFARLQNIAGNPLPNAPKNKIAFNATYDIRLDAGTLSPSISYVWRGAQFGALFNRPYDRAPSWAQVDGRVTWRAADGKYTVIAYIKNAFNQIGHDGGAYGTRIAGTNYDPVTHTLVSSVANLNGPTVAGANAYGIFSTYSVTPPRTFGIELQYKFF